MILRVHGAAEVMAATPGCLTVDCWANEYNHASGYVETAADRGQH